MLRLLSVALLITGFITSGYSEARQSRPTSPSTKLFSSHHVATGGHYVGGKGSSHKGGKYVNRATKNHYKKHKH
jgi:hypothetical protein